MDERRRKVMEEDIKRWEEEDVKVVPVRCDQVEGAVERTRVAAGGGDGVKVQMVKWGGKGLWQAMARLFTMCAEQKEIPEDWEKALLVPLGKGVEIMGPESTRGVSLMSVVEKVYEKVILERLKDEVEWEPNDAQGGYRKGHGADMWVWVLRERMRKMKKWVVVTLDWRKAFDKVWREAVLWKLRKVGVKGQTWQDINRAFRKVQTAVRLNGRVSRFVALLSGLKQGGVLSPWLFALFVDDLVCELVDVGYGGREKCEDVVALLFVDDLILMGKDVEEVQKLVDVVGEWGKRWGMELSTEKSKWMSNRGGGQVKLRGKRLERVEKFKYLGVMIQAQRGAGEQEKEKWKSVVRRRWALRKFMGQGREWGTMEGLRMWEVMVKPMVWWAVGGWEPSKRFMEKVSRVKRGLLKQWMGVAVTQSTVAVEGEVGMLRAEDEVTMAKLMFWGRLVRSESRIIQKTREGSELAQWVRKIQQEWGIGRVEGDTVEWKKEVTRVVRNMATVRWRAGVEKVEKLEMWKEMDSGWGKKWWIEERPDGWRSMVKMRMEDGLLIEKGRYKPRIPREKRVCTMCGIEVEDTWHLMGECKWIEVERKEFWDDVRWKLNAWWNVEMMQKGRLGLSTLGGRSLLVAEMERMSGWDRVKTWLGGRKCEGVMEEEWKILYREAAGFCKRILEKRKKVIEEGHGSVTAARALYW